jgi:hypothetical protein
MTLDVMRKGVWRSNFAIAEGNLYAAKEREEVIPTHRVEGLRDVELEEQSR